MSFKIQELKNFIKFDVFSRMIKDLPVCYLTSWLGRQILLPRAIVTKYLHLRDEISKHCNFFLSNRQSALEWSPGSFHSLLLSLKSTLGPGLLSILAPQGIYPMAPYSDLTFTRVNGVHKTDPVLKKLPFGQHYCQALSPIQFHPFL